MGVQIVVIFRTTDFSHFIVRESFEFFPVSEFSLRCNWQASEKIGYFFHHFA